MKKLNITCKEIYTVSTDLFNNTDCFVTKGTKEEMEELKKGIDQMDKIKELINELICAVRDNATQSAYRRIPLPEQELNVQLIEEILQLENWEARAKNNNWTSPEEMSELKDKIVAFIQVVAKTNQEIAKQVVNELFK